MLQLQVVAGFLMAGGIASQSPVVGLMAFLAMAYTGFDTGYYTLIGVVGLVIVLYQKISGSEGGYDVRDNQ